MSSYYVGGWDITEAVAPVKAKRHHRRGPKTEQWEIDFVRLHHAEMTNVQLAKALHRSLTTAIVIKRRLGLTRPLGKEYIAKQQAKAEAVLKKRFKEGAFITDMAREAGVSPSCIRTAIRRLGYELPPDAGLKARRFTVRRMIAARQYTPEYRKRLRDSRNKVVASERRRLQLGLPQRTRLRVVKQPAAKYVRYHRLARNYGYISDIYNNTLYFTDATRRRLGCRFDEGYYTKKCGIRFRPMPQKED